MKPCKRAYLGDCVYAECDGYQIRLFTQEGNQIFLDSGTLASLMIFIKNIKGGDDEPPLAA